MQLILPSEFAGQAATRVFCVGRVIRIVASDSVNQSHIVAATIVRYRLVRGSNSKRHL